MKRELTSMILAERVRVSSVMLCLIMVSVQVILGAETFLRQGFDDSTHDTWEYSASASESGFWGVLDNEFGGTGPYEGNYYWGSWNLNNRKGVIQFDNVILPLGYTYEISFYYYTKLLNSPEEYSAYTVSYDNGLNWASWQYLESNNQIWTQVIIPIPLGHTQVTLKVATNHSGTEKYSHWDSFNFSRITVAPMSPQVSNIVASQRLDGSSIVDIHYDLLDLNNDPCTISVSLSDNDGISYNIHPEISNMSGDIGEGITSGVSKHIIWEAGNEDYQLQDYNYRFRIHADDSTYPTVSSPYFVPSQENYFLGMPVSIYCDTPGSTIHYTTDGSDPTTDSDVYMEPLIDYDDLLIRAYAVKDEWQPSPIVEAEFSDSLASLVYVPSGSFIMGDTRGQGDNTELPLHSVQLDSFYISRFELTQGEYYQVTGENPASGAGVGDSYPIYYVSWYDAIRYCNLKSILDELTPVYSISGSTDPDVWGEVPTETNPIWNQVICNWDANGYRLPTEAEWEYAARGATNYPDYLYSGSDVLDDVAWHLGINNPYGSKPVGTKMPNGLGLYDMSGNVYEMCWDWYDPGYYIDSPLQNPKGPSSPVSGNYKVLRGGQWSNSPFYCRVSMRRYEYYGPSFATAITGFRVCRSGQ